MLLGIRVEEIEIMLWIHRGFLQTNNYNEYLQKIFPRRHPGQYKSAPTSGATPIGTGIQANSIYGAQSSDVGPDLEDLAAKVEEVCHRPLDCARPARPPRCRC